MFIPASTAPLSRHLLLTVILFLHNVAGFHSPINRSNKQVFMGDSVTLDCNISEVNPEQISWNKDGVPLFSHKLGHNKTIRNFTYHRMSIDPIIPTKLEISNIGQDDAGIYCCSATTKRGVYTTEWNLTVSERESPKEISSPSSFPWVYLLVIGLILSAITCSTVWLCRKRPRTTSIDLVRTRTPRQDQAPVRRESGGGEYVLAQHHGSTDHRTNDNRTRDYIDRLNPIYG